MIDGEPTRPALPSVITSRVTLSDGSTITSTLRLVHPAGCSAPLYRLRVVGAGLDVDETLRVADALERERLFTGMPG